MNASRIANDLPVEESLEEAINLDGNWDTKIERLDRFQRKHNLDGRKLKFRSITYRSG